MSIAVSAVIRPSRLVCATQASYAAANLGAGLVLASGAAGSFAAPQLLALCCALAGLALLRTLPGVKTTRRIDISGPGQIRLTVQQDVSGNNESGVPVSLMPGSTVWPAAMLLLLRDESGRVTVLMVLPDSVAQGGFRALAVAIRAIAGHDNTFFGTNKNS